MTVLIHLAHNWTVTLGTQAERLSVRMQYLLQTVHPYSGKVVLQSLSEAWT